MLSTTDSKGNVENLVGTVRRQALAPMPVVRDWAELNARLRAWFDLMALLVAVLTAPAPGPAPTENDA